jgi:hypothetical protein
VWSSDHKERFHETSFFLGGWFDLTLNMWPSLWLCLITWRSRLDPNMLNYEHTKTPYLKIWAPFKGCIGKYTGTTLFPTE